MRSLAGTLTASISIILAITILAARIMSSDWDRPLQGIFPTHAADANHFSVVSWNIERGYRTDRVARFLHATAPAICLLQEVDLHDRRTDNRDVAHDLARQLGYSYAYGIAFQELSQSDHGAPAFQGQATLTRFPIARSRILRFEQQSSFWKPHTIVPNIPLFQRRQGGRIALVTDISVGKTTVVVYNLHLESRSGGAIQHAQLQEVFADLAHYRAGTPAIIGGDLNSKYNPSAVLKEMQQQGFTNTFGNQIKRTHILIGMLDWIFIRGGWQIQSGSVERGTHASDHDPVVAELIRRRE